MLEYKIQIQRVRIGTHHISVGSHSTALIIRPIVAEYTILEFECRIGHVRPQQHGSAVRIRIIVQEAAVAHFKGLRQDGAASIPAPSVSGSVIRSAILDGETVPDYSLGGGAVLIQHAVAVLAVENGGVGIKIA